ncbi:uncharacterized protein HfgLR_21745 (plasmid) [Haloferax gibbonsii]|uniref:Uncharacterized protein n=1 Tax=Haloferax gibbonsii TaxID=35746 RepID=A0A871BLE5_HALGI|nr:uncharacterized protein HfgLR_21745 [Haloferax gibbonsii]
MFWATQLSQADIIPGTDLHPEFSMVSPIYQRLWIQQSQCDVSSTVVHDFTGCCCIGSTTLSAHLTNSVAYYWLVNNIVTCNSHS